MKPRTKFEHKIATANKKIKGINPKAVVWAMNKFIEHYAFRNKNGVAYCGDCGLSFLQKGETNTAICPHCGRKLIIKNTRKRTDKQGLYFSTLHFVDGMQVQRVYKLVVSIKKGEPLKRNILEVCRLWLTKEGKKALTALKRTMGYYRDTFDLSSDIELRIFDNDYMYISNTHVYPKFRLMPELKRNGLKNFKICTHPFEYMLKVLTDSRIETLLKNGNERDLSYFLDYPNELNVCWKSYKIALRHGYKIENIHMWCDMIKMLVTFNKDIHSIKYICPNDFTAEHDKWTKKLNKIREIERKKREIEWEKERLEYERIRIEREKSRESEFTQMKSCYFGIVLADNEIEISVLNSVKAYLEEGEAMNHCVYAGAYFEKPDSIILSAHYPNGDRIETIEFSLTQNKVIQCYGKYNKETELHDRIVKLVNDNAFRFIEAKMKTA